MATATDPSPEERVETRWRETLKSATTKLFDKVLSNEALAGTEIITDQVDFDGCKVTCNIRVPSDMLVEDLRKALSMIRAFCMSHIEYSTPSDKSFSYERRQQDVVAMLTFQARMR